jgi:hypothetical protein
VTVKIAVQAENAFTAQGIGEAACEYLFETFNDDESLTECWFASVAEIPQG